MKKLTIYTMEDLEENQKNGAFCFLRSSPIRTGFLKIAPSYRLISVNTLIQAAGKRNVL